MRPFPTAPDIRVADVIAIAREAGKAILPKLTPEVNIIRKADGSPVTEADSASDAIIEQRLSALAPTIPILSEEGSPQNNAKASASSLKWVVDPLDGTNTAIDYAHGEKTYDQFSVNIALVKNGVPILGVAHFPAMAEGEGVTYFTGENGKAYKQTGELPPKVIAVSRPPFKRGELRAAVHYHENCRADDIAGRPYVAVPGVGAQRLCKVAEGSADVADMNDIIKLGYSYKQCDFAAAHAVLRAAGGQLVIAETGQPLVYNSNDLQLPGTYAGGRETLNVLGLAHLTPLAARAK